MGIDHLSPEVRAEIDMLFDNLTITLSPEKQESITADKKNAGEVISRIVAGEEISDDDREAIGKYHDALSEGIDQIEDPYDNDMQKIKVVITMARLKFENGAIAAAEEDLLGANEQAFVSREVFIRDETSEDGYDQKKYDKLDKLVKDTAKLGKILYDQIPKE